MKTLKTTTNKRVFNKFNSLCNNISKLTGSFHIFESDFEKRRIYIRNVNFVDIDYFILRNIIDFLGKKHVKHINKFSVTEKCIEIHLLIG